MRYTAIALALLLLLLGPVACGTGQLGTTNFDDIAVSGDLTSGDDTVVGDDITVAGDLKVGNGTPGVTLNGEDAYVEGTFEVDGASTFDGAAAFNGLVTGSILNDLNGGALTLDPTGGTTLRAQVDDTPLLTLASGTGVFSVRTGNFSVGNGTSGQTEDGEDAYIEGMLEVDGAATFDGAVVNNSTTQLVGAVNLDGAVDLDGVITNAANLEHVLFPSWVTTAFTYTAGAGGTVTLATAGAGEIWFVQDVRLNVTTDFAAVGDDAVITIGRDEDIDGFCVLADAELQIADTEGTGWDAGWQCQVAATRGVFIDGTGGYILTGAETIDAIISAAGNDLSTGAATAYILYTRLQ